jgi:methylated-DNA-protein-cysteine methyltransferase-like protein
MPTDNDFFEQVYAVVRLIPKGKVTSYGAIAQYLGRKGGARLVGWAMNASIKSDQNLPAHRVVNRNGLLTGKAHFPGEGEMQKRLEAEGIEVLEDQIQDFKRVFWDPVHELELD